MRVFFDHIAGNTTCRELVYSPATAIFTGKEYTYALQNGWHIAESWGVEDFDWYNEITSQGLKVWYQARSTRIEVSKFEERARHRKKIKRAKISCEVMSDVSRLQEELWRVYNSYLAAKNFENFYADKEDLLSEIYGPRSYLVYRNDSGRIIGFGIVEVVSQHAGVAPQFAWDYADPSIGLGSLNKLFQFRLLKDLGITHLYLGTSYENPSRGKAKWPGFEWWTGRSWSNDTDFYFQLLERESAMKTLDDLYETQKYYYSRLS